MQKATNNVLVKSRIYLDNASTTKPLRFCDGYGQRCYI